MADIEAILKGLAASLAGTVNTGGSSDSSSSSGSNASIADQASTAIDQFRSVGKWIITSFAAVATLLLAGVQLTSLGSIQGGHLFAAFAGLAAAVGASLVAIIKLTSLLQPHVSTEDDAVKQANEHGPLAEFINGHQGLFYPAGVTNATDLQKNFHKAWNERSMTPRPSSYSEDTYKELRRSLVNLVWMSSYEDAKRRFDDSRSAAVVAAVVVAVGASLYAWAATTPSTETGAAAAVEPAPVAVTVKLTSAGSAHFSNVLSKECIERASKSGVPAIALSASTSQTTVVLIPTPGSCAEPTKISIPLDDGSATAAPVKLAVSPPKTVFQPIGRGNLNPK